jgi:hypothetical protein
MVSSGAPKALKAAAAAFALAALGASGTAAAAENQDDYDGRQRELFDRIEEIQTQNGQYAPELLDILRGLILLYRENEQDSLAIVILERALQVVRANSGLYSLDQVPFILERIHAEEARGNHAEVWHLEQELLTLVRRHPDDLRTVPVVREMADRQMAVLERVLSGERHPNIVYGCFYKLWPTKEGGSCIAGSRRTVVQGMFAEAQRNYSAAIGTLLRNGQQASEELRELEMKLLRGVHMVRSLYEEQHSGTGSPMPLVPAYIGADSIEPWRSRMAPIVDLAGLELPYPTMGLLDAGETAKDETRHVRIMDPYHRGRQSLRRLYAYGEAVSSTPLDQADLAVQIADWDLLYSHNGEAVDRYRHVYATLVDAGVAQASIDELFAPATPVILPAFEPNPLVRDGTRPTMGHIDVSFVITKYGRARGLEIRDEMNATDDDKRDLEDIITNSRFRPRPMSGQFGETAPILMRYYLSDSGTSVAGVVSN